MNNKKTYIERGKGEPILLLHGLFGALSNWKSTLTFLSKNYRVIIPLIPITEVNIKMANISGLTKYIEDFVGVTPVL